MLFLPVGSPKNALETNLGQPLCNVLTESHLEGIPRQYLFNQNILR